MIRPLLALVLLLASHSVFSQELSQYTATRVQKAHQLAQDENIKEAIDTLKQIETSRPYDQAFVARMLGVFLWQDDQPQAAIEALNQAVASGLLRDEQSWVTKRMLADLYLNQQQFERALVHYYGLTKGVPQEHSEDDIWLRIAQSHYQLEQWRKVLPAANQYMQLSAEEPLQALSLKLGAQLQLKLWKKAIPTLEQLIVLQPDKVNWWRQLAGLQIRLEKEADALNTLSLAKLNKLPLTQNDRRMLAQLYAKRGIPERAAMEISELDHAYSDAKLLAEQGIYWQSAKEWDKAIEIWKLAAELDKQYQWNVAQLMVQQGQYQEALPVLNKVEGRRVEVALAKTRALYKLNRVEDALIEAKRAQKIEASPQVNSWIRYLTQIRDITKPSSS